MIVRRITTFLLNVYEKKESIPYVLIVLNVSGYKAKTFFILLANLSLFRERKREREREKRLYCVVVAEK